MDMDDLSRPVVQTLLALLFIWLVWRTLQQTRKPTLLRSVVILVLGDIGRSPRMMYHAESFATIGFDTFLVGYAGSKAVPSLLSIPHVHFCYLSPPPTYLSSLPFLVSAPYKVMHQVISILYTLLVRITNPPEFIVVQNPPSIPTLALVWLGAKFRGSKVIIDWHNLGYSILALKLGERHIFVRIAKWFERYFGRTAYAHLFVTHAMRDFLVREWGIKGHKVVLHDRPPAHFHRASPTEIHELFLRLLSHPPLSTPSLTSFLPPFSPPYSTPFTSTLKPSSPSARASPPESDLPELSDTDFALSGAAALPGLRADRPALLVSSTSWTPDEDFGMLLEALQIYERRARALAREQGHSGLPKVLMVVTGKGPLRDTYMRDVDRLQWGNEAEEPWHFVRCVSMWLEAEDYPRLLGSADLGISLHSSSSALDLPMKVVDMFGCGLPVCALGFACLNELVKDGVNGLVFNDASQLAEQLKTLLTSFPSSDALATLRASLEQAPTSGTPSDTRETRSAQQWEWGTWAQNWSRVMKPLLLSDVPAGEEL